MKKIIGIYAVLILVSTFATGCSSVLSEDSQAPQITGVVTDLPVLKNSTIELTLEYVEMVENSGEKIQLIVDSGDNYGVSETTVIPDQDFVGDLKVPVYLKAKGGSVSETDTIIVSVVSKIDIQPLLPNSEWHYEDMYPQQDSVGTSHLSVSQMYTGTQIQSSNPVYELQWMNFDSVDFSYLFEASDSGLVQWGGFSEFDTLVSKGVKLQYPTSTDEAWAFSPIDFNVNHERFAINSNISVIKTKAEEVYLKVSAGIFKTVHYQYSYTHTTEATTMYPQGVTDRVFVNLYYAPGVGFIANHTYFGTDLILKKELTHYSVEEL